MPKQDPFSEEFSTQASYPYFNPKKIGDACRGYLVATQVREDMHNDAMQQRVYILEVPEGETYNATTKVADPAVKIKGGERMSVYGRFPMGDSNIKVIDDFEGADLGRLVGVKYDKDRTSKAGKVYKNWNTFVFPEQLEGYDGQPEEGEVSEEKKADIPF
jgi:hypothetical protein